MLSGPHVGKFGDPCSKHMNATHRGSHFEKVHETWAWMETFRGAGRER
jgi:hypothetical protein